MTMIFSNDDLPVVTTATTHASPVSAPFSTGAAPLASGPAHEVLLAARPVSGVEPATSGSTAATTLAHVAVAVLLELGLLLLDVQPVALGRQVERGLLEALVDRLLILEDNESEIGDSESEI